MRLCASWISVILCATGVLGAVPTQISHQGVVAVNGNRFPGPTGKFRFAIVDGTGAYLWANDDNTPPISAPTTDVTVDVANGVYAVQLGAPPMQPVPASVFAASDAKIRIWFDDGVNNLQLMVPDQALSTVPYAVRSAFEPPIGSIIAWHKNFPNTPAIPNGWAECNGQTLSDSSSPYNGQTIPNLNSTPAGGYSGGGRFLRGSLTSGLMQEASGHFGRTYFGPTAYVPRADLAWAINADGSTGVSSQFDPIVQSGPILETSFPYQFARPVNMSVVWIMRVK